MSQKSQKKLPKSIKDMGGTTSTILRYADPADENWCATNPSIGFSSKYGYGIMVRSTNYLIDDESLYIYRITVGNKITNRMWFSEVNQDLDVINLREVSFIHSPDFPIVRGIEDPRLFSRNGNWYISGVMLEDGHTPRARLCLYEFDPATSTAKFMAKFDSWDPHNIEKNWMVVATEYSSEFDYVYGACGIVKDGKFEFKPNNSYFLSNIRGGSCLWPLDDGTYLAVVHEVEHDNVSRYNKNTFAVENTPIRKYLHRFAKYSSDGYLTHLSDPFIFDKYGIEFVAGMVVVGSDVVISYGYMDASSRLARISLKIALSTLKEI